MKFILIGLIFFSSFFAHAEDAKIEITSFLYAGSQTRAAELCGKVTGMPIASFVVAKIVVDDKSDKPGVYNTLVGKDGKFCTAVVSYYGTASASVEILGKALSPEAVATSNKNER